MVVPALERLFFYQISLKELRAGAQPGNILQYAAIVVEKSGNSNRSIVFCRTVALYDGKGWDRMEKT